MTDSVPGRITPRKSWPRPATPTTLAPAWAGEFRDFEDWVSFASTRLTGTFDPLTDTEVPSVCIDSLGRRCTMGAHFMRARDEHAFPVRFFWDCEEKDVSRQARLQGFLAALAAIVRDHNDDATPLYVLESHGITRAMIEGAGLDEHDMDPLKLVMIELDRRADAGVS